MDLTDVSFIYDRADDSVDVVRCLETLILTPVGTVPLDRDFGLDQTFLSYPISVARNIFAVELIKKAKIYEPRATIKSVDLAWSEQTPGTLSAKVRFDTNGNNAVNL